MTGATATGAETPPMSLAARLIGVVLSPGETYKAVAAHPRWLGALVLTTLVGAALQYWLLSTEVGREVMLETQVETMEAFGATVGDQEYAAMESQIGIAKYFNTAAVLIFGPITTVVIAGLSLLVFSTIMGGAAGFKQVFAVVAHSGVIWTLAAIFNTVMGYTARRLTGGSSLAVFFPMVSDSGFAGRFLGFVDLFWIWGLVNLAIGLGVLYKRRPGAIAMTFIALYLCIGLLWAAVRSFVGSGA